MNNSIRPYWSLVLLAALALGGCSDPPEAKEDDKSSLGGANGRSTAPLAFLTKCETNSDCDDSLFCTGEELCEAGYCQTTKRIDCNDDIKCTIDRCNEESQLCEHDAPDEDGDGHPDASCLDEEGTPLGDDCNDEDPLSYPGNVEVCDESNRDEDCNPSTIGYRDADNDGYLDALCCNPQADGVLSCGDDCDDHKSNVNPAEEEACDYLDNNCDGETDEGVSTPMYPDTDHDGHGDSSKKPTPQCPSAVGFAAYANDCDDADPEVFNGQFEICDGKDNNCDPQRLVDEIEEEAPWFLDEDGDGYGDPGSVPVLSCYRIKGRVLSRNDCDDAVDKINPHATEICDGKDNDCNGLRDYKLAGTNNFEDDDNDGVADADCGGDDCNDRDSRTAAGAEEVCDHVDNDCDGEVDEQTVQNIWYIDEDGDGWGVVLGSALASCNPLENRASNFGDCDDSENGVHPGTTEYCDGTDNDCDGSVDEGASVHCQLDNAIAECAAGACGVFSCVPGFRDADGDSQNGCEEPLDAQSLVTDVSCASDAECTDSNLCTGIEKCVGGFCQLGTPINCESSPTILQGDVLIQNSLDILAIAGIEFITGNLIITNTLLTSLVGFEALHRVGGHVRIQGNTLLTRLSGSALSNLVVIGGDLIVSGNPELNNVNLPSLLSTGSLQIVANQKLKVIGDYPRLSQVERLLLIDQNPSLTKVEGFAELNRIGGSYELDCSAQVPDLYTDVCAPCVNEGGLLIQGNSKLNQVDAFQNLLEIEGDLCLQDHQSGTFSLAVLEEVGMSVSLVDNLLTGFSLPVLSNVGGSFLFHQETFLDEIALPLLSNVRQDVRVYTSTSGLDISMLKSVGGPSNNGILQLCTGTPFDGGASTQNAACSDLERIEGSGFVGQINSCGQCADGSTSGGSGGASGSGGGAASGGSDGATGGNNAGTGGDMGNGGDNGFDCGDLFNRPGTTPCGLNSRGVYQEECTANGWMETLICSDPDVCADDTIETGSTPCGLNNRGFFMQVCSAGQWLDSGECPDPDICLDGSTQSLPNSCGIQNTGTQPQLCTAGQWANDGACIEGTFVCSFNDEAAMVSVQVDSPCDAQTGAGALEVAVGPIPALSTDYFAQTPGVDIKADGDWSQMDATLTFFALGQLAVEQMVAIRVTPSGEEIAIASIVSDQTVTIPLSGDGNYTVATVSPQALPGCTAAAVSGQQVIATMDDLLPLENVTHIAGDLLINGTGIADLSALACLRQIDGSLTITGNGPLTDTSGLSQLVRVSGDINFLSNSGLTSINLPELLFLGGDLTISDESTLDTVSFSRLARIVGGVSILRSGLDANTTAIDFGTLAQIGSSDARVGLLLRLNPNLINLDGFSSLVSIEGDVVIDGNEQLESTAAINQLSAIGGELQLTANDFLQTIDLSHLFSLNGALTISGNSQLSMVDLRRLETISNAVTIQSNGGSATLTTLNLSGLTMVGGSLTIASNPNLTNLDGLSSLTTIVDGFIVENNAALLNIDGLSQLAEIDDSMVISGNRVLNSLFLPLLVSVDGMFEVSNNPQLPVCAAVSLLDVLKDNGWDNQESIFGNLGMGCGGG